MENKNKLILIIFALLIICLIIFLFLFLNDREKSSIIPSYEGANPEESLLYEQLGMVKELNKDFIIIEKLPRSNDMIKALITRETLITRAIISDEWQQDGECLKKEVKEEEAYFSDIKMGDIISVLTDEKIEGKEEFKALKITIPNNQ